MFVPSLLGLYARHIQLDLGDSVFIANKPDKRKVRR